MRPSLALLLGPITLLALVDRAWAVPQVGEVPPALTITDWVKGKPFELHRDTKGKTVVLEFWATWCPPCIQLIPDTTDLYRRYKSKGLVLLAVTDAGRGQSLSAVRGFVDQQGAKMDYPIAYDRTQKTLAEYGAYGLPHAVVIDKTGKVAWIGHPGLPEMKKIVTDIINDRYDPKVAAARARFEQEFNMAVGMRDWTKALTATSQILDVDPGNFDAMRYTLAIYLEEIRDLPAMRKWVDGFYRANRNNGDACAKMATLMLAMPELVDRQPDLAVRGAELAYSANPTDLDVVQSIANVWFQIGDLGTAINLQKAAVKLAGNDPAAAATLAFYERCRSLHVSASG